MVYGHSRRVYSYVCPVMGPACLLVSFAFILQPMGHLEMFQNLAAHRACPLTPTCSQSRPACHRSGRATVSSPDTCRDYYRGPCNPQTPHLCPPCPYMALRHSKLFPTFMGPQNLTLPALALLIPNWKPCSQTNPRWPVALPQVAPAPMIPLCLGPSSCAQLWLLPGLPTSLSQTPMLTCGVRGLPTLRCLGRVLSLLYGWLS